MQALVFGGSGFIGSALVKALKDDGFGVLAPPRKQCDLRSLPDGLPKYAPDAVYICAAMSRFIDCERNSEAYAVNVDAPITIAKMYSHASRIIFLSSEAVEQALHTNYGMHKALAEIGLRGVCDPIIVRLSKVVPQGVDQCCGFLVSLVKQAPGIYRWS